MINATALMIHELVHYVPSRSLDQLKSPGWRRSRSRRETEASIEQAGCNVDESPHWHVVHNVQLAPHSEVVRCASGQW